MNILIIGSGSVGLGLASCLAGSTQLSIVSRSDSALLNKHGITRTGIFGPREITPNLLECSESIPHSARPDVILVCSKAFDAQIIRDQLAASGVLSSNAIIVLCHNGWGTADCFAEVFPKHQIFNARIITGFTKPDPRSVDITVHAAPIHFGNIYHPELGSSPLLTALSESVNSGGIPAAATPTVAQDLWAKMLYNCALNPLGAVLGATYGELGESPDTVEVMDQIITEIYAVMHAHGFSTHWETCGDYRKVFYESMIPLTRVHRSSMLQDISAGRRTEIDYLSGSIVRMAQKFKLDVPANKLLLYQVRFLQAHF